MADNDLRVGDDDELPSQSGIVDYTGNMEDLMEPIPEEGVAPVPENRVFRPKSNPAEKVEAATQVVHTLIIEMPQEEWDEQFDTMQKLLGGVPTSTEGDIVVPDNVIVLIRAQQ